MAEGKVQKSKTNVNVEIEKGAGKKRTLSLGGGNKKDKPLSNSSTLKVVRKGRVSNRSGNSSGLDLRKKKLLETLKQSRVDEQKRVEQQKELEEVTKRRLEAEAVAIEEKKLTQEQLRSRLGQPTDKKETKKEADTIKDNKENAKLSNTPEESKKVAVANANEEDVKPLKKDTKQQQAKKIGKDVKTDSDKETEKAKKQKSKVNSKPPIVKEEKSKSPSKEPNGAANAIDVVNKMPAKEDKLVVRRKNNVKKEVNTESAENIRHKSYSERRKKSNISIYDISSDNEGLATKRRSEASYRRAKNKAKKQKVQEVAKKITRTVDLPDIISVQELSNRMSERAVDVIKELMKLGSIVTINQNIDSETAQLVIEEMGHKYRLVSDSNIFEELRSKKDSNEINFVTRFPIVTVMGHVDHGKTSLLDAMRKTDVVSSEAGGITQHIGAYKIATSCGKEISFIDTPGHEAFSSMRARGAGLTDIVILVVAANDSIMPQTIEAIHHAKAAKAPIIVAINKIDLPNANADKVKQELLQHDVVVEDYQGDVQCVEISAKFGTGLDALTEAILLQSEMLELKTNPNVAAEAIVVEAKMDLGRGPVATVLVQEGVLKVGDIVVVGTTWGKVRSLYNDKGEAVKSVRPSSPVEITGLNSVPVAGDELDVVENEQEARNIIDYRHNKELAYKEAQRVKSTNIENIMEKMKLGDSKELPIIVKAGVQGSVEAIIASLQKLSTSEVEVNVIHGAVGAINESDITLAQASDAVVFGFNVRANPQARALAQNNNIEILYHNIIYNVIDDVKNLMVGLLEPVYEEELIGYAEVREIFTISKRRIAGCLVTEGYIKRGVKVRLLRDNIVVHEGKLSSLRRFKDEVKEVKVSYECGICFENFNDIQTNDIIECYNVKEATREL